ncbi:hypothetical protein KDW_59400 [Dictyobacter vulcani]|uniref:Beta-lactamase-related domain-containing protein n=1 Tax=Dictyobacter vulcani TaxID=2607529 RepID=A0A5J4KQ02_9CHLR|nr:serine hydrolase domain-containing protein [Dictyobacter vulcani]GER91778.1 hypothetical protein KDW_59400 [Dictyobacter vulcani]
MHTAEIEALLTAHVAPHEPGMAVALVKDGQILYRQGHGLANLEWEQAVTPQTVFGLGSVTKPFTATLIMLLEQQGKLRLDAPIQTYLPDYPRYEYEVTLTHLLTHTSGIPNFVTQPGFWEHGAHLQSVAEIVASFQDLPLEFEPGTRYSYCNSGYVLLGCIIEKILDLDYGQALQSMIFEPLEMTHSSYLQREDIIPYRAGGYERNAHEYQNAPYIATAAHYAAGGIGSSLDDLLLWQQALRAGRLLDHQLQARMYTPLTFNNGERENYGLGWGIGSYRGHAYRSHAGGVPGYSSFICYFPQDDLSIILLSNRGGFNCAEVARQLTNLVLDLPPLARTTVELSPERFKTMAGTYSGMFGTLDIQQQGQQLYLQQSTLRPLIPISESSFYLAEDPDVELHFEQPDAHGHYRRLRKIQPFFWFTVTR